MYRADERRAYRRLMAYWKWRRSPRGQAWAAKLAAIQELEPTQLRLEWLYTEERADFERWVRRARARLGLPSVMHYTSGSLTSGPL